MKKMSFFIIVLTLLSGCKKEVQEEENMDIAGTKWISTASYIQSSLYFENSASVQFSCKIDGDYLWNESVPYKISKNMIEIDEIFLFEKIGNHIYWINLGENDLVLKYVMQ